MNGRASVTWRIWKEGKKESILESSRQGALRGKGNVPWEHNPYKGAPMCWVQVVVLLSCFPHHFSGLAKRSLVLLWTELEVTGPLRPGE